MKKQTQRAKRPTISNATHAPKQDRSHLRLVPSGTADAEERSAEETAALAFDALDDMCALVPMLPTIPLTIRQALTLQFALRFEHYEDLDRWLHADSALLGGRSPFEALVAGQGREVLKVLVDQRHVHATQMPSHLRLIR